MLLLLWSSCAALVLPFRCCSSCSAVPLFLLCFSAAPPPLLCCSFSAALFLLMLIFCYSSAFHLLVLLQCFSCATVRCSSSAGGKISSRHAFSSIYYRVNLSSFSRCLHVTSELTTFGGYTKSSILSFEIISTATRNNIWVCIWIPWQMWHRGETAEYQESESLQVVAWWRRGWTSTRRREWFEKNVV